MTRALMLIAAHLALILAVLTAMVAGEAMSDTPTFLFLAGFAFGFSVCTLVFAYTSENLVSLLRVKTRSSRSPAGTPRCTRWRWHTRSSR
jgi:hypothetical protein